MQWIIIYTNKTVVRCLEKNLLNLVFCIYYYCGQIYLVHVLVNSFNDQFFMFKLQIVMKNITHYHRLVLNFVEILYIKVPF